MVASNHEFAIEEGKEGSTPSPFGSPSGNPMIGSQPDAPSASAPMISSKPDTPSASSPFGFPSGSNLVQAADDTSGGGGSNHQFANSGGQSGSDPFGTPTPAFGLTTIPKSQRHTYGGVTQLATGNPIKQGMSGWNGLNKNGVWEEDVASAEGGGAIPALSTGGDPSDPNADLGGMVAQVMDALDYGKNLNGIGDDQQQQQTADISSNVKALGDNMQRAVWGPTTTGEQTDTVNRALAPGGGGLPTNPNPTYPLPPNETQAIPDQPVQSAADGGNIGVKAYEDGSEVQEDPTASMQSSADSATDQVSSGTPGKPTPAAYVTGQDAVPSHVANFYEKQVDPDGSMDPAERNLRAIAAAPDQATQYGMVQYNRKKYGAMRAIAQAALQGSPQRPPNIGYAAHAATAAMDAVPDGNKVTFNPTPDGKIAVNVRNLAKKNLGMLMNVDKQGSAPGTMQRGDMDRAQNISDIVRGKQKGYARGGAVPALEGGADPADPPADDPTSAIPEQPVTAPVTPDAGTDQTGEDSGNTVVVSPEQLAASLKGPHSFYDTILNSGMWKWLKSTTDAPGVGGNYPPMNTDPESGASMPGAETQQQQPWLTSQPVKDWLTSNPGVGQPGQPTQGGQSETGGPLTGGPGSAPRPVQGAIPDNRAPTTNAPAPAPQTAPQTAPQQKQGFDRDAVFSRRIEGAPKDIQDLADGVYGAWASQAGAKNMFIAQAMEERWKQEAVIKQWQGRGMDAAALHGQVQAAIADKTLALKYAQLGIEKFKDTLGPAINAIRTTIQTAGPDHLTDEQKKLLAFVTQSAMIDMMMAQSGQGMGGVSNVPGQVPGTKPASQYADGQVQMYTDPKTGQQQAYTFSAQDGQWHIKR